VIRWFYSYLFSFAAEMPFWVLLARPWVRVRRSAPASLAGTAYTHPLLWFVWPGVVRRLWRAALTTSWFVAICPNFLLATRTWTIYVVSGELIVGILEAVTFYLLARPIPFRQAVAASYIANAASFGLGKVVRWLGVPI
jgi:hypothetical protein